MKLQAFIKGGLVREQFKLLKLKQTRILAQTIIRLGDSLLTLRIIENIKAKTIFICAFDPMNREQYEKVVLPKDLIQDYSSNLQGLLSAVDIVIHK